MARGGARPGAGRRAGKKRQHFPSHGARARAREDTWLAPDGGRQLVVMWRNIEALIPYARNARTHSDAQIAQIAGSIREFGFTNPVLIDEAGGIIAGHGRPQPRPARRSFANSTASCAPRCSGAIANGSLGS